MQFIGYRGAIYNVAQIVKIIPPKVGVNGTLVFSNGEEVQITPTDYSELKTRFDVHVSVIMRG